MMAILQEPYGLNSVIAMRRFKNAREMLTDKFVVRFPDGLRGKLAQSARNHKRSMNTHVLLLLEPPSLDALPEGLELQDRRLLELFRSLPPQRRQALLELLRADVPAKHEGES